jgi:hypothetical protein
MRFATFTRAVRIHFDPQHDECDLLSAPTKRSHHRPSKECIEDHGQSRNKSTPFKKRRLSHSLYNLVQNFRPDIFKQSSMDEDCMKWRCNVESDEVRMRNAFDTNTINSTNTTNWTPPNFLHNTRRFSLKPLSHRSPAVDFSTSSDTIKKSSRTHWRHSTKLSWSSDDTIVASCPDDVVVRPIDQKQSNPQEHEVKAQIKRKLRRFTFAGLTTTWMSNVTIIILHVFYDIIRTTTTKNKPCYYRILLQKHHQTNWPNS